MAKPTEPEFVTDRMRRVAELVVNSGPRVSEYTTPLFITECVSCGAVDTHIACMRPFTVWYDMAEKIAKGEW